MTKIDTSFGTDEGPEPPVCLQRLRDQFQEVYRAKYPSRVLTWRFGLSEYTVQYVSPRGDVELVVGFDQMLVLMAFDRCNALSVEQIMQNTQLSLERVVAAVAQLCDSGAGPVLVVEGVLPRSDAVARLNETPAFASSRVRVVPETLLAAPAPVAAPAQDMTQVQKTVVDAEIVRVMKRSKFMSYSDLVAALAKALPFLPEVGMGER